jgi:hypothetical protein
MGLIISYPNIDQIEFDNNDKSLSQFIQDNGDHMTYFTSCNCALCNNGAGLSPNWFDSEGVVQLTGFAAIVNDDHNWLKYLAHRAILSETFDDTTSTWTVRFAPSFPAPLRAVQLSNSSFDHIDTSTYPDVDFQSQNCNIAPQWGIAPGDLNETKTEEIITNWADIVFDSESYPDGAFYEEGGNPDMDINSLFFTGFWRTRLDSDEGYSPSYSLFGYLDQTDPLGLGGVAVGYDYNTIKHVIFDGTVYKDVYFVIPTSINFTYDISAIQSETNATALRTYYDTLIDNQIIVRDEFFRSLMNDFCFRNYTNRSSDYCSDFCDLETTPFGACTDVCTCDNCDNNDACYDMCKECKKAFIKKVAVIAGIVIGVLFILAILFKILKKKKE